MSKIESRGPDPMNPNTLGWLAGELGAPVAAKAHKSVTYEVHDGRMIPQPAK
jgi:hypothetical protein